MTRARHAIERRLPFVLIALAVGIAVNFVLLIPALNKLSDQAAAGRAARDRSCALLPASTKVYTYMQSRHVITAADLALFTGTATQVCSPK